MLRSVPIQIEKNDAFCTTARYVDRPVSCSTFFRSFKIFLNSRKHSPRCPRSIYRNLLGLTFPFLSKLAKKYREKTFLLDFFATDAERWSSSVNDHKLSLGRHILGRECKRVLSIGV